MNIKPTKSMDILVSNTDEALDLIENFCMELTPIPFEFKIFYRKEKGINEYRIILAIDLMIDNWEWYYICRAPTSTAVGLALFYGSQEIPEENT